MRQIISAKYKELATWLTRNIGPTELLAVVSVSLMAWGFALVWFPLSPLFVGLCGLVVSVINARMR